MRLRSLLRNLQSYIKVIPKNKILVPQNILNDTLVACSFKTQGVLTNLSRTGLSAGRPKLLFFPRVLGTTGLHKLL